MTEYPHHFFDGPRDEQIKSLAEGLRETAGIVKFPDLISAAEALDTIPGLRETILEKNRYEEVLWDRIKHMTSRINTCIENGILPKTTWQLILPVIQSGPSMTISDHIDADIQRAKGK